MAVNAYINFSGNCREAVNFYSEVFKTEKQAIMSFGDLPANPEYPIPDECRDYVMHTFLNICGGKVMFSDLFPDMKHIPGNNISIAIVSNNADELKGYYEGLIKEGTTDMEPQETEWSPYYSSVTDKFGITWQLNCEK